MRAAASPPRRRAKYISKQLHTVVSCCPLTSAVCGANFRHFQFVIFYSVKVKD